MNKKRLMQIFKDTAYSRTGGSPEEKKCADYLISLCSEFGVEAAAEPFKVEMASIKSASLTVDGRDIPCKGYFLCGSGSVSAPLYYLANADSKQCLSECSGKIVMIDGYLRHWVYQDMLQNGAVGFITYDGNANYKDRDIDQRELRSAVSGGNKIPGVNINVKDAVSIIKSGAKTATISVCQDEYEGESQNVIADLKGDIDKTIVFTAHYDSTSLSQGAYDNMSGSVGLAAICEYFSKHPHRHSLKFIWCGSEERGLLGSKAYCQIHENELENIVLNINLDMIGSAMGRFIACCTSEEKLAGYIEYMASELGFGIKVRQDVYSSDSTPFADKGVPAVSFARLAPENTATIHNSYDTLDIIRYENMASDIEFITAFAKRMADSFVLPVGRKIPDNIKEKLDIYLLRKRDDK